MMPLVPGKFLGMLFVACSAQANPSALGPDSQVSISASGHANIFKKITGSRSPPGGLFQRLASQLLKKRSSEATFVRNQFLLIFSQRTEKDVLSIEDTCHKLNVDSIGCSRVKAYLGKALLDLKAPLHLKLKVKEHFSLFDGDVVTKEGLLSPQIDQKRILSRWRVSEFAEAFKDVPKEIGDTHPFIFAGDDWAFLLPFKYPTLVRPSPVPDPSGNHVIVRQSRHHYEDAVKTVSSHDLPFQDKQDTLVWRGTISGSMKPSPCTGHYLNRSRALLVQKYSNTDDRMDVGFTELRYSSTSDARNARMPPCQGCPSRAMSEAGFVGRDSMDMTSLLKHKFIMVVEGNDVGSSTEWIMSSNSVPFMAPPSVQTWGLHSWLVPWKHYVPVEPDFSDVSSKLDWAISNPTKAEQIARAGVTFMKEFEDKDREDRIAAAVLVTYFDRVRIEDSPVATSLVGEKEKEQECSGDMPEAARIKPVVRTERMK